MNKLAYIGGGLAAIALLLIIPVHQSRVLSYGVDTYSAHHPLYGSRTAQETLYTKFPITSVGAILVDMRRSHAVSNVHILITDATNNATIQELEIPGETLRDDMFSFASITEHPIPAGKTIQIQFSAPDATNKNPIGLRFDPNTHQLAVSLGERVPLWEWIITTVQNRSENWKYISFAVLASIAIALFPLFPNKKIASITYIVLIASIALLLRMAIIPQFDGVSGGDAYNYLSISQSISHLQNPFANTKRLPGYPLILVPFYNSNHIDIQYVMRTTQTLASIAGVILIIAIARTLSLSWPTALASSAILAFQKDYFFTSMRPEPYSMYTVLLLVSVLLFLWSHKRNVWWIYILFGLALGYSAMTRQEGFVLAVVLGISSVLYEAYRIYKDKTRVSTVRSFTRFATMYVPALIIVLPFFINSAISYGNPLYTQYLEGDRLQIVDSYPAFQDALGATWGIIGSMWKPSWDHLERLSFSNPLLISSALGLFAWYSIGKYGKGNGRSILLITIVSIFWIGIVLGAVYGKTTTASIIPIITAGWILASIPIFLLETRIQGILIFAVVISQILIATWFHPFAKHYQQSYPFIALFLAHAIIGKISTKQKLLSFQSTAAALIPFFVVAVFLSQNINAEIDNANEDAALDSVTYRAARLARTLPGPIGFDQAYLPARLYFDPNAKYFPDEELPTVTMEQQWLQENPIKTLIVTNGNNVFKTPDPSWKKVKTFKAAGKHEKIFESVIYSIP